METLKTLQDIEHKGVVSLEDLKEAALQALGDLENNPGKYFDLCETTDIKSTAEWIRWFFNLPDSEIAEHLAFKPYDPLREVEPT